MNKRQIVLILSFTTIVAYGYALGGAGSWFMGNPKPQPVILGLFGGTACAVAALKIWRVYMNEIEKEDNAEQKKHEEENSEEKDL